MKRRRKNAADRLHDELYERLHDALYRRFEDQRRYRRSRALSCVVRTLLVLLLVAWHVAAFALLWLGATDESIARAVAGAGMVVSTAGLARRCL